MMTRTVLVVLLAIAMVVPLAGVATAQQLGFDPAVEREVLHDQLITPTGLAVADDGRVVIIHREGRVTVWEQDGTVTDAVKLPVDAYDRQGGQFDESACPRGDECPAGYNLAEGGIHGILLAPDFLDTGHLYLYYSPPDTLGDPIAPPKMPGARQSSRGEEPDEGLFRLSRFTMDLASNTIDLATEVELFENPAEWFYCCHYGGDMAWRSDGTLLLSTGDDTTSDESGGYSPHDQRPEKAYNSAALTSQNLADRRGKILRIDVVDLEQGGDGVPGGREGIAPNPFSDDPDADPYVYALGFRSNYRFAYNPDTDHIYVGNVGPDARNPDPLRGPAAHDEIEVVPPGGGTNHGWPYCIADNIPYNEVDFATGTAGDPFSCAAMTPATVSYTYTLSPTNPYVQLGTGGNTALGGVAYVRPDSGALRLPATYDDQFLWLEHSRGQMWRMPINDDGTLDGSPTTLLPVAIGGYFVANTLRNPIEAEVGPDGAVYLIEGNGFWNSTSGMLSRITCAGCTPDAADYGGAPVAPAVEDLSVASVDGGLTAALPLAGTLAVLAALGLAVGLRRRTRVV